jgi:hypothetical protein
MRSFTTSSHIQLDFAIHIIPFRLVWIENDRCFHQFLVFGETTPFGETLVNQKVTKTDFKRGVVKMKIPASQYFAGISWCTERY